LQSGIDLITIQAWLGHATPNTTHHYLEADVEMKRRALEKCADSEEPPALYQPPDDILALLDSL
ncbi:MAG: integrase, partial [Pseudomonadota bacterium]